MNKYEKFFEDSHNKEVKVAAILEDGTWKSHVISVPDVISVPESLNDLELYLLDNPDKLQDKHDNYKTFAVLDWMN